MPIEKSVVLDTNILISSILTPSGKPARIFAAVLGKRLVNYTTLEILEELRGVLNRQIFQDKLSQEERSCFLKEVYENSKSIVPHWKEAICSDKEDDKFINCALTVGAEIISGDRHLLRLIEYKGVKILSAAQFLATLD